MQLLFYYVNALAAAGKTHQAIIYALQLAALGQKVAIAQPSKQLIGESYRKARDNNPQRVKVTRIDSTSNPRKALSTLVSHLKGANPSVGEVLFITHASLFACPYWHEAGNWTLIIDEIPEPLIDVSLTVPHRHALLTSLMRPESYNAAYDVLLPRTEGDSPELLRRIADNKGGDQVEAVFTDVARKLLSDDWSVFCNSANYRRVTTGAGECDEKEGKNQLMLYALMHPTILKGFKTRIVMGAMFTERNLYALWGTMGVEWKEHKKLTGALRYSAHDGGSVTIEYVSDRGWSKSYMHKGQSDGRTPFQHLVEHTARRFAGQDYIYILNNSVDDDAARDMLPGGTRMPVVCHGLNQYDRFDNMAFMPALNPTPSYYAVMETFGVSGDEIRRNGYLQSLYQGVMRCSLRDLDSAAPKTIVVPCADGAAYLQSYFPGSAVKKVGSLPGQPANAGFGLGVNGRPKLWRDDKARAAANNAKRRVLAELAELHGRADTRCISIIPSIYSREVVNHEISSNQALMVELRQALSTELSDKKQNILISPARFNTAKSADTTRGLDNIESVYGVWLDNDGGDLTHEQFRAIFPKLWMAAFSTFSGGNRYRVFIPTSAPMTVEADAAIKRMIFAELSRAGYDAKGTGGRQCHGFDVSKITPSSLFYIPCRAKGSEDAFFAEYDGEELDPFAWLERPTVTGIFDPQPTYEHAPADAAPAVPVAKDDKLNAIRAKLAAPAAASVEDQIEQAKQTYLAVPAGIERRNVEFFKLGARLQRLGLSLAEVEQHLRATANDADRRKQVKSIISTLRRKPAT